MSSTEPASAARADEPYRPPRPVSGPLDEYDVPVYSKRDMYAAVCAWRAELGDLAERLRRADRELRDMALGTIGTTARDQIAHKAEGVRLALSYVEEAIRVRGSYARAALTDRLRSEIDVHLDRCNNAPNEAVRFAEHAQALGLLTALEIVKETP